MTTTTHGVISQLEARLEQVDLRLSDRQIHTIAAYIELLIAHGKRFNLIGTLEPSRVIDELIVDSCMALKLLPEKHEQSHLLDIGSGAGIPGIPLVVAYEDMHATLIEPRKKRAMFIRHVLRTLLPDKDVQVLQQPWDGQRPTDIPEDQPVLWVSRAVFSPEEWLDKVTQAGLPNDRAIIWVNDVAHAEELGQSTWNYQLRKGKSRAVARFNIS